MSHAQVTASEFVEELHPRGAGGQFGTKTKPAKKAAPAKTTPKRRQRRVIPAGQLGFDGVRGTGYGLKGGDKRVRALQEQLNRLGLTDLHGKKLVVDGKLGPLTTSAIKAAQLRLGMRATGIIAPAFIDRLAATRALPAPKRTPAKKAVPRTPVKAKFNPDELRNPDGTWTESPAGAVKDALKLADRIRLGDGESLAASGRLGSDSHTGLDVVWAAIDSPRGREVRIATVYDSDAGKWRAANKGSTATLSASEAAQLRDGLSEANKRGRDAAKRTDAAWDSGVEPTDPVLRGEDFAARGRLDTAWGPVTWGVYVSDGEPASYDTEFKVGSDESADGVLLGPKELRRLVSQLDGLLPPGEVKAASRVAAAELRGIELARPGTWQLSSGTQTWTDKHITDAARYANRKGARPGYVKIGHVDPRFDGEPALGWVHNVRREVDERGPKLVGDIEDMPDWLAAAARKHWPYRSIEGWSDFTDPETGETYALVMDGVALLGVTPPGVSSIQSLRDLPKAVGIAAASGVRVVASMASAPVAAERGAGPMDPAKTREALGLAADAPDDEVRSAMQVALQSLGGDAGPAQQPVQASLFGDEPVKTAAPVKFPDGVKVIAASVWEETQNTIRTLTEHMAKTKRDERDEVIATAVKAGKILPVQRQYFQNLWDQAPEGTRELIANMTPNSALSVMASGYAGDVAIEEDELDREIARLSRPEVRNG